MKEKIIFVLEVLAIVIYPCIWRMLISPLDILTLIYVLSMILFINGYCKLKDYFGER